MKHGLGWKINKLGWTINGPISSLSNKQHCFRTKTRDITELEAKFDNVFRANICEDNDTTGSLKKFPR